jgi:hypothetical protein
MAQMNELTIIPEIALAEREGEPRALDLDIGKRLGLTRPRDLRKLIERNLPELEAFGTCATVAHVVRGNEVTEYWLNEEQALLVATLSEAPNAPAVRSMLIRTFVAWRRGHLMPITKGALGRQVAAILDDKLTKLVTNLLPAMVEERLAADPRIAALEYVSVRELLEEHGALQKGRGRLNRKIGYLLKGRALLSAVSLRKCPHSEVWLYPRSFASEFMAGAGRCLVAAHNDAVRGQGRLHLVRDTAA